MRIDYSEPKKSYTSAQSGQTRGRQESSGTSLFVIGITAVLSLSVGFGSGWMLSQRSAKKGFKAAMEQQSIENSPRQAAMRSPVPASPQQVSPPVPQSAATQQQSAGNSSAPVNSPLQSTPDPPLSFYKNLPSGQKSNVLGSGINNRDEKPAKQSLQAAIPSNVVKPPSPQSTEEASSPPLSSIPPKSSARQETGGFVVQAASYSLKSEAETLRNKLASKGYNAYISESQQGDRGTWYRVRVGKKLEQDAAKELAGKLGKGAMPIPDKD